MRKSSKRKEIARRQRRERLYNIAIITILISLTVVAFIPTWVLSTDMQEEVVRVEIEEISEPEQSADEIDRSNFKSIYEEELIKAKEEEKVAVEAKNTKFAKAELVRVGEIKSSQQEELWYLAKGIHGEASICDRDEKYRVGTVIMNRVERSDYPNTVKGVISSGEYSCYQDARWYSEEPSQEEWEIAKDIYENGVRVFESNVVYQSAHAYGEIVFVSEWHEYGAKK